jgi:hypothetical protein
VSGASPRPGDLGARLVELFVLAPLGAGARLASDLPQAVSRARQELSNARFIGRMVVEQGTSRLAPRPPAPPMRDEAAVEHAGVVERPDLLTPAENDALSRSIDADELAIPDYDHLPALDIVGQLDRLSSDERAEVERYERAHRGRRTVLGKIAQLDASA